MHEVLVNRLGGLSLPRKSVVRLTDRPDMTLDVYRGRKTTDQHQQRQESKSRLAADRKPWNSITTDITFGGICGYIGLKGLKRRHFHPFRDKGN